MQKKDSKAPEITVVEHTRADGTVSREYRNRIFISDLDADDGFLSSMSFIVETDTKGTGKERMTGGRMEFRDCSRSVSWSFDAHRAWDEAGGQKEARNTAAKIRRVMESFQAFHALTKKYLPNETQSAKKTTRKRRAS